MPASVATLGEIVPEEYLDQRAGGCFEAKFLAQVYSAPACGKLPLLGFIADHVSQSLLFVFLRA
jgi:hypothetical protein